MRGVNSGGDDLDRWGKIEVGWYAVWGEGLIPKCPKETMRRVTGGPTKGRGKGGTLGPGISTHDKLSCQKKEDFDG